MKRLVLSTLLLFLAALLGRAQTTGRLAFEKGANIVNLGIGLGAQYGGGLPLGLAYDQGVTDKFSLGAQIDYYSWEYRTGSYRYAYRFAPIAVRGAYHFTLTGEADKLDLYAGVALGYRASRFTSDAPPFVPYSDQYDSRLFYGIFAGGRYYVVPQVGIFSEIGYGVAWLKLGAVFRF